MAKQKFDGVVEAVRYTPSGQIEWVRAYKQTARLSQIMC